MKPANVLIIEDNLDEALLMVNTLEYNKVIFNLFQAENAQQARNILSSEQINVTCLDLGLPDSNGIELIREIIDAGSRCVVVSGTADLPLVEEVRELGAYCFVKKPLSFELFHEAVKEIPELNWHLMVDAA